MTHYSIVKRWGDSEENPSIDYLINAIDELDVPDPEHPDAWLVNEDINVMVTLHENGMVIISDVNETNYKHIISKDKTVKLNIFKLLIDGNINELNKFPWLDGRGIPMQTVNERKEIDDANKALEMKWYDEL